MLIAPLISSTDPRPALGKRACTHASFGVLTALSLPSMQVLRLSPSMQVLTTAPPLPLPHRYAFGILTALYLGMMRLGYATFGVSLSPSMQVLTTAPPSLFPTGTRRLAT